MGIMKAEAVHASTEELFIMNASTENNMKKMLIVLFMIAIALPGMAKVPYKLKNGTLIDADRLNFNFEYIERQYDNENEYELTANGQSVGFIRFGSTLYFNNDFNYVTLHKNGTFKTEVTIYFTEQNCIGDLYMTYYYNDLAFMTPQTNGKVAVFNGSLYYYKPEETNVYRISPQSSFSGTSCQNYSYNESLYLRLKPNDPLVTGIPAYPLPLPLKINGAPQIIIHE